MVAMVADKNSPDLLPPHLNAGDRVILFDGVCKLCNSWSNFVIKHDTKHRFKLASVQSREGKDILRHFGYPIHFYETMLVVHENICFEKSEAFFYVMRELGYPWKLISYLEIAPAPIRNFFYDRIALNRYKIFGRYDYCSLPNPDHDKRYLNGD